MPNDIDIVPIKQVDATKRLITLAGKGAGYKITAGNRFFVQNVFEELDSPGEWYFDTESGTLYFWPPADDFAQDEAVVPALDSIVQAKGAKYVRITGFHIQACNGTAVSLQAAEHCALTKCILTNTGKEAIRVGADCSENEIAGNDITATGTAGIQLAGTHNTATNNHIHHFSVIVRYNSGISVAGKANAVSHNLIHDGPTAGIYFRGSGNIVEYNRIHHVNFEANDSCIIGMYCGGSYEKARTQLGNIIRYNFVSDSGGYSMRTPGQWVAPWHTYGIRMDDLTSGVTVFGNIIARTVSGGIQIHSGKDNIIENNVFADASRHQVCFSNSLEPEKKVQSAMSGNRFVRNIVCYSDPKAILFAISDWTKEMIAESDYNVFFHFGKSLLIQSLPGVKPEQGFAKWRELGYEAHSQVADPLFADATHDDYRLKPESPVLKVGFKPIPVEKIGLYASPDRVTWPVDETHGIYREEPLLTTPWPAAPKPQ